MSAEPQADLQAIVDELSSAVAEIAGGELEAEPAADIAAACWVATLTTPDAPGHWEVVFDHAGASGLTRLALPGDGDVEEASIADLLRKIVATATAALASRPEPGRIELTLSALEPRAADELLQDATDCTLTGGRLSAPFALRVRKIAAVGPALTAETRDDAELGSRIDVILDIDLPVVVRFGHTELPIRTLSRLGPGSVIDLGRSPDDPVEVLVSNRVVARGEVVIVGGNYGVRILDVASQSERARSMEA